MRKEMNEWNDEKEMKSWDVNDKKREKQKTCRDFFLLRMAGAENQPI